jgi:hypothetical protein
MGIEALALRAALQLAMQLLGDLAPKLLKLAAAAVVGTIAMVMMIVVVFVPAIFVAVVLDAPNRLIAQVEQWLTPAASTIVPGAPLATYFPMYAAAGARYGIKPALLASIHEQETAMSTSQLRGVRSGYNFADCCAGPMQFNVKAGSWAPYSRAWVPIRGQRPASYPLMRSRLPSCAGVAPGDGCVYDDFDEIAGAAAKLHHDGATMDLASQATHDAVCGYVGDCAAVDACGGYSDYCAVIPRAIALDRVLSLGSNGVGGRLGEAAPGADGWTFPTVPPGPVTDVFARPPTDYRGHAHKGIDIGSTQPDTKVVAYRTGRVSYADEMYGYGNYVCVDHEDLISCYAHLASITIDRCRPQTAHPCHQWVRAGQPLGIMGDTPGPPWAYGVHLHFELRTPAGVYICPAAAIHIAPATGCNPDRATLPSDFPVPRA